MGHRKMELLILSFDFLRLSYYMSYLVPFYLLVKIEFLSAIFGIDIFIV